MNSYFQIKYVGNEQEKRSLQMEGLNLMDKTLSVQGARISFRIWDVAGALLKPYLSYNFLCTFTFAFLFLFLLVFWVCFL